MGPIEVRYLLDEAEIASAADEIRKSRHPFVARFILLTIGLIGLGAGLWAIASSGGRPGGRTPGVGLVLLVAYMLFFLLVVVPLGFRGRALRVARRSPLLNSTVTWTIDGERLSYATPLAETALAWGALAQLVRTSRGFLLYLSPSQILWIPEHGFIESDGPTRLIEIALERVPTTVVRTSAVSHRNVLFDPTRLD